MSKTIILQPKPDAKPQIEVVSPSQQMQEESEISGLINGKAKLSIVLAKFEEFAAAGSHSVYAMASLLRATYGKAISERFIEDQIITSYLIREKRGDAAAREHLIKYMSSIRRESTDLPALAGNDSQDEVMEA